MTLFVNEAVGFTLDGQPINERDTPAQLEMKDVGLADVFRQQTEGVY
jgi:hypothetical protein